LQPWSDLGLFLHLSPIDRVATDSYIVFMNIPIKDAKNRLTELARRVEAGETITITRNGKPVADLVPHKRKAGIDLEAGDRYLRSLGVDRFVSYIAPDFDDPLPKDFLITPEKD
jgi:prevent-host-death family protein